MNILVRRKLNQIGKYDEENNVCYVDGNKVRTGEKNSIIRIPKIIQKHNINNKTEPVKLIFLNQPFDNIKEIEYCGEIEFENCFFKDEFRRVLTIKPGLDSNKNRVKVDKCFLNNQVLRVYGADLTLYDNSYRRTSLYLNAYYHVLLDTEFCFADTDDSTLSIYIRDSQSSENCINILNSNIKVDNLEILSNNNNNILDRVSIENSEIETNNFNIINIDKLEFLNSNFTVKDEIEIFGKDRNKSILLIANSDIITKDINVHTNKTNLAGSYIDSRNFNINNIGGKVRLIDSILSCSNNGSLSFNNLNIDYKSKIKGKNIMLVSEQYPITLPSKESIEAECVYANGNVVKSYDDKPADISLIKPRNDLNNLLSKINTNTNEKLNSLIDNTVIELTETSTIEDINNSKVKTKVLKK